MFDNIMKDLFPNEIGIESKPLLYKYISQAMEAKNLDHNDKILQKVF